MASSVFSKVNPLARVVSKSFSTQMADHQLSNFVQNGKKILGAALNYHDVLKARKLPVPKSPVLFLKPTTSYIREDEPIIIPKQFTKVAHEVELGVIIKNTCKNVSRKNAMDVVGGYCLALDLTAQCELGVARSKGNPWSIGKGFDTSTPVSRFISTQEVTDPHKVKLWCKVNGKMRQNGNTSDLIFDVPALIEYASSYMTLEANDLILTGTMDGADVIKPGDVVECGFNDLTMKFDVKS